MSHTLCVWQHMLYIWLETHFIYHHIYCICHHTHSVEDITPTKWDSTGDKRMPLCALYMTPYPPFRTATLSIYDITCPLLMTSHALYMTSSTVYGIPFTICVISHNACISDITHPMFMTYPLYMESHRVFWEHNYCVTSQPLCLISHALYLCHQCCGSILSNPVYVWHHSHYVYDIICTTCDITSTI